MADNGQQSGTVTEVARQVADRADSVAGWLGEREPGDLLEEVRSFARRRPGAFLATALAAGFVVGRLGKGVAKAGDKPSGDAFTSRYPQQRPSEPPAATGYPATSTYPTTGTAGTHATGTEYAATGTEYAATGTEYAATGTGEPIPVPDEYPPETRR